MSNGGRILLQTWQDVKVINSADNLTIAAIIALYYRLYVQWKT